MSDHVPPMSRRIMEVDVSRPYLNADEIGDLLAIVATLDTSGVRGEAGGRFGRWSGVDSPWITVSTMWNRVFLMDIETRHQNRPWPRLTAPEMADFAAFPAHRDSLA